MTAATLAETPTTTNNATASPIRTRLTGWSCVQFAWPKNIKMAFHWRKAGLDRVRHKQVSQKEEISADGTIITTFITDVRAKWKRSGFRHTQTCTLSPSGMLRIDNEVVPYGKLPPLPRLGLLLTLPEGFEDVAWYGRGPHENYRDRNRGARIGRFSSTVSSQHVPYIYPQENGNKTDVRWLEIGNGSETLHITALTPFEFTVSHFTVQDLEQATHTYQLKPRPETYVYLDYANAALGGASCGPGVLEHYKLTAQSVKFSFMLSSKLYK